jgi:hypothetical protein
MADSQDLGAALGREPLGVRVLGTSQKPSTASTSLVEFTSHAHAK